MFIISTTTLPKKEKRETRNMADKENRESWENHPRQDKTNKQAKADNIHTNKGIFSKQRYAIRNSRGKTSQGVQTSFVCLFVFFFFCFLDFSLFYYLNPMEGFEVESRCCALNGQHDRHSFPLGPFDNSVPL